MEIVQAGAYGMIDQIFARNYWIALLRFIYHFP